MPKYPTCLRARLRQSLTTRKHASSKGKRRGTGKRKRQTRRVWEEGSRGDVGLACDKEPGKGPGPCASSPDPITAAGVQARLDPLNRRHRCSRSTRSTDIPFVAAALFPSPLPETVPPPIVTESLYELQISREPSMKPPEAFAAGFSGVSTVHPF
jgi:hypothetical protein